ncbi:bifunctional metallophosphatase/5'-nucleotidase [Paenibacillus yonginensis]|uniref:Bifunctional metallophosphatase/5'-nucleotidase n=1 Tax=Paenibacillus yonginensis TaxID=1462996 RepID=A0A1B1MX82_9BACL|nr:5'-nucleotidase C-terminal domain-containing protein [Paenibacillus yonginensis]ANS73778.1 bifunctional metallophosphatase/5'-nucleotidase [Paenibacillus yonginensis]
MNFGKKPLGKAVAAAVIALGLLPGFTVGAASADGDAGSANGFEFRILHTNDTHAHLDNIARRVTAINEARTDNTLLLDAGDVFSGTLYFNQYNGLADLYFMNKLGYDAMTFGNHEFDKGPATLAEFVEQAKFPFVSANVDFSTEPALNGSFHQTLGQPGEDGQIYPAIIKEINGQQIGIIGLTTPESAVLASPGPNIKFQDEVESAQKQVDALEQAGINKIIALTHLGYTVDQQLAEAVKGIDIIVGGHSHTQLNDAEVHHADTEPTLIVQTGEYDNNLGQLDVTFDENGVLTAWKDKLIALDAKDAAGNYVIKSDAESETKLAEFAKPLDELKKTIIGKAETDLNGERGSVRKEETNLGDLMADGMRAKVMSIVHEPDVKGYVTIQNGGGIRASIGAGDITLGDLLTMMPFGNNLSAVKMTGKEITAALENGVSGVENGEGRFPQVSGMRFFYDSTKQPEVLDDVTGELKQAGSRMVKVQIQNSDGTYTDIDPDAYYIVATNSYMADGGDFYRSMKAAKNDGRYYELNLVDYEVFREYLETIGTVKQSTEGRITDLKGAALPAEAGGVTGSEGSGANAPVFTDLADDSAKAAIEAAAAAGLVQGYGDGTFRPDQQVTRAELAVMVSRAFQVKASEVKPAYSDAASIPAWAEPAVAALKAAGLLDAFKGNTFAANQKVTAAEAANIIAAASGADASAAPAKAAVTRRDVVLMLANAVK